MWLDIRRLRYRPNGSSSARYAFALMVILLSGCSGNRLPLIEENVTGRWEATESSLSLVRTGEFGAIFGSERPALIIKPGGELVVEDYPARIDETYELLGGKGTWSLKEWQPPKMVLNLQFNDDPATGVSEYLTIRLKPSGGHIYKYLGDPDLFERLDFELIARESQGGKEQHN